jgi:hypothetical protein
MQYRVAVVILLLSVASLVAAPSLWLDMADAQSEASKAKSKDVFNETGGSDPNDENADASSHDFTSSGGNEVTASSLSSQASIQSSSSASAFGDFNGDLLEDLAIGVPGESLGSGNSISLAGAVNVLYGSGTGLQATGTGGPDDQFWTQGSTSVKDTVEELDRFGWSLASGDFNGDGRSDLAIGVPFESTASLDHIGGVNVLYGSATGLQATGTGGPDDQFWTQDSPNVQGVAEQEDFFGQSLAVGDFNGDPFDDLAIGAPGEDLGTGAATIMDAGAVTVLYGSPTGLQATGTGGPDDQGWTQNTNSVQDDAEQFDRFSEILASGDFNGDLLADLAVGVPFENVGGIDGAGAVNVLYGSPTGLQATGTGGPDDQFWSQDSTGVIGAVEAFDSFGNSLASGDFNGDLRDDLAIGVPFEDLGSGNSQGAVSVIYGSATGLQATGTGGPDDQFWSQDTNSVKDQAEAFDFFGLTVAGGNFNGDLRDDLAIGVPLEDLGTINSPGAVNVLYGSPTGLQATGTGGRDDQFWTQDSPNVQGVAEDGDRFGDALGTGDFDNDGNDDLAIGVPHEVIGSVFDAGSINVIYGSATGLQATGTGGPNDQGWSQNSTSVKDASEDSDNFGFSLAG